MEKYLLQIGSMTKESEHFSYDSIGISENRKTLGVGYLNNRKASILVMAQDDHLAVSYNEKVKPNEALAFFINILEQIPTKIIIVNDFK
jgi:hypothetical protein